MESISSEPHIPLLQKGDLSCLKSFCHLDSRDSRGINSGRDLVDFQKCEISPPAFAGVEMTPLFDLFLRRDTKTLCRSHMGAFPLFLKGGRGDFQDIERGIPLRDRWIS